MIPFPKKKYSVIYADPPWQHRSVMVNPFRKRLSPSSAKNHYSTLALDDLKALPVENLAADDALLFMWVTTSMLEEGLALGKAWGFKYKQSAFVWDKQRTNPGYYTMTQCELCLVFKCGRIPKPRGKRNILQFLSVKRGNHSVKPYEARDRITEMFPHHEKIELFARERFDGWDAWGNEV